MALFSTIKQLYEGDSRAANRFRYALLGLDLLTIAYLIISTFFYAAPLIEWLDLTLGLLLLADYAARFALSRHRLTFIIHPLNITDALAIISFILPLLGQQLGFLRSLRILRLLRSYRLQKRLREDFAYFRHHEDIIFSATNLMLFIFIMTELVFVTQVEENPNVRNFLDAMYFTVTTLTTTGFGDITLYGQNGRLLSIIIMIFGVSLFLRLVQTVFRPTKVRYPCPACGLFLHDIDAVHCKHCGKLLAIPNEGL